MLCFAFFSFLIYLYWLIPPGLVLLPHDSPTGILILQKHTEGSRTGGWKSDILRGRKGKKGFTVCKEKKLRVRVQELCTLISRWVFQPGWGGDEGEKMGMWTRRWERERERQREGETERGRGVSFSSVWPFSHSNSGLATWTLVLLSSPTAQNLTLWAPESSPERRGAPTSSIRFHCPSRF